MTPSEQEKAEWMSFTRAASTPGSPEAVNYGCTCPILDNAHGRGRKRDDGETIFVAMADCPLHGERRNTVQKPP